MYAGTVLRHGRLQFSVPVMVRRRSENPPCIETLNIRHHRLPEEWKIIVAVIAGSLLTMSPVSINLL